MTEQNGKITVVDRKPVSVFDQLEHEMADMRRRMQSVFRRPFAPFSSPPVALETAWAPTADAYEADGKFIVKAELPGVKQEDVTVRVEDGFLTISAKRQEEKERKEAHYHTCERFLGTVQRSFALPDGIETEKITAAFKDGMLEVQVPLPEQVPAKARGTDIPITG